MKPDSQIHLIAIQAAASNTWVNNELTSRNTHPNMILFSITTKYAGDNSDFCFIDVYYNYQDNRLNHPPFEDLFVRISISKTTSETKVVRGQLVHYAP